MPLLPPGLVLKNALACFHQKNLTCARKGFNRLTNQAAYHHQTWLYLSRIALLESDLPKAIDLCQTGLGHRPQSAALMHQLATCLQQTKQLPNAINSYRKALELRLNQPTLNHPTAKKIPFDQAANEQLLWQTLALLAQQGIFAFATSGTLLGLMREGQLLAFDKDIDIGLPFEQMAQAIELLTQVGWQEEHRSYGLINPRCFRHSSGLLLDVCGYGTDLQTGGVIGGLWMEDVPMEWNRITDYPALQISKAPSAYGDIYQLTNADQILTALYADWRTPDPQFDTIIAAKNLRGFSLLTQCFAYSRIYSQWHRGQLKQALKLVRITLEKQPNDTLLQQVQQHIQQVQHD